MVPLHDITKADFWRDPAASYARILARDDWLFHNPYSDGLIATQYAQIAQIARHPAMQAVNRSKRGAVRSAQGATSRMLQDHPNFQNEPHHAASRAQAIQTVTRIGAKQIAGLAREVVDKFVHRLTEGPNDLVSQVVLPTAAEVWSIVLTGVPDHAMSQAEASAPIARLMAFDTTADDIARADAGSAALMAWALAQDLNGPAALSAAMTFDGIDGAAGLTANALWLLISTRGQWQALGEDRARVAPFVSEAARLVPNILGLERCPVEDVEIDGQLLPAGTNVLLLNAVGNRDPRAFHTPNQVDLSRRGPRELSFGFGGRSCVGRLYGMVIAQAVVSALLDRCDGIHLQAPVLWSEPGQLRTPLALPCDVRLRAAGLGQGPE